MFPRTTGPWAEFTGGQRWTPKATSYKIGALSFLSPCPGLLGKGDGCALSSQAPQEGVRSVATGEEAGEH